MNVDGEDDGSSHEGAEGTDQDSGPNGEGTEGTEPREGSDGEGADDAAEHVDDTEDDGESGSVDEPAARARSRAETRFQKLANEAKAARDDAAAARAEAREIRNRETQRDQHLSAQQEAERLALMTPEERADYKISRFEERAARERQNSELGMQLQMDKVSYEAKATLNPVYAKYADEVEKRFEEQRAQGRPVEREVILKFILGERALNGASSSTKRAKAQGDRRIQSQRSGGGNSRGDVASQRGKQGDSAEKRLKGVYI